MKYKLLAIDLDGTLLDDNKEIGQETLEAIQRASDLGIKIALITGRMPAATESIKAKLKVPCILACNAGTYILKETQCISSEYLTCETMKKIYDIVMKYTVPLWIFRHNEWMVTGMDDVVQNEIELVRYVPEIVEIHELSEKWELEKTGPNKVLVGAKPMVISQIYRELKDVRLCDADMALSAENYLEIFPKGMNKGRALQLICEKEAEEAATLEAFVRENI